jgi:hypothetical protein
MRVDIFPRVAVDPKGWIVSNCHAAEHAAPALSPVQPNPHSATSALDHGAAILTRNCDFQTLAPPQHLLLSTLGFIPNGPGQTCVKRVLRPMADLLADGQSMADIG